MKGYGFTKKEFFKFNTSENISLNGWMVKPPNFDVTKKYPVLMYVYGGPGDQTVENKYSVMDLVWPEMLAQKGIIVVSVDNRGTSGRGADFKKCTYGQLGKLETVDQIEAAKYLGSLAYVDKSRIGIWGWSYGGYMTALCLTKGADYFKMGMAVAPVTNWRYYDNIYTERYMGLPKDNAKGYDDNSPVNYVKKLKGKFLLVHGTADDNVHVQNSMMLATALVNANKQFEMQFYPNKNHSIYGGNTRYHLFTRLTEFVLKNL
jgi:dipeptidyl-peptidase-4